MIFLVYCIVSLFYDVSVLSPPIRAIFHTSVAGYSLFVPLNPNKPNREATFYWHALYCIISCRTRYQMTYQYACW